MVRVGDIAEQIRGVTFSKGDSTDAAEPGFLPVLTASNLSGGEIVRSRLTFVPAGKIRQSQLVRRGDVVVCTSSGSRSVVGKAARCREDLEGGFGAFLKVLRPGPEVDPDYFAHFFQTPGYRTRISAVAAGANINNLTKADLDDLQMPLPARSEQRRIAAILDQADTIRAKRHQMLAHLDSLTQSIFHDMFGAIDSTRDRLVGEVAVVSSGITKGRRTSDPTTLTPYLAVANVQAGHLKLEAVKEIAATAAEIQRYELRTGDLVLTEGGDPDKLGRGTVWRDELPLCLHQNHIFRVRPDEEMVLPEYLSAALSSRRARDYFLRSAKQTTGIASINMTQLRAAPVPVVSLQRQQEFLNRASAVAELGKHTQSAIEADDELFASLQARAFNGER